MSAAQRLREWQERHRTAANPEQQSIQSKIDALTEHAAYLRHAHPVPVRHQTADAGAHPSGSASQNQRADGAEKRSQAAKEQGNKLFAKRDYQKAIDAYDVAIAAWPENTAALCNRALCKLKLGDSRGCLADCDSVLRVDSGYAKAWHRRGQAHAIAGNFGQAAADFERVLALEPANTAAAKELAAIQPQLVQKREQEKAKKRDDVEMVSQQRSGVASSAVVELVTPAAQRVSAATSVKQPMSRISPTVRSRDRVISIPSATITLPSKGPHTSFEFEAFWHSAIRSGQQVCAGNAGLLFEYMKLLSPHAVAQLFTRAIDAELFAQILLVCSFCLESQSAVSDDVRFVAQLLGELPRIARFDMNVMFLSSGDRIAVRGVIERLVTLDAVDENAGTILKRTYQL